MTILKRNDQSGRSMVEMLGVLAIIGVLSVGGISGYSKAMAKYKLTKAQDQVTMLLMNIRTAYATSPSYAGLTSAVAADYNLAPNEMKGTSGSTTVLYGTFGGEVKVSACDATGAGNACDSIATTANYFGIKMLALGKEACRSLASSDWGAHGLVGIKVNSQNTVTPSNLPISFGSTGCDSETNSITWVYY